MSLSGTNDNQKLVDLSSRNYRAQAIWVLNSFWKTMGEKEGENIWNYTLKIQAIDQNGAQGTSLDEMMAHRFLEVVKETLTVREMREKLFGIGIDRPKYVSLAHYLIFHYNLDWHYLVNAAQGDNQEEVNKAQKMLESVQAAFVEVKKTAEESVAREAAAKQAKAELEAAGAELKAQENAYNSKTEDLKRKSEQGSVVQQNKAKAELAQHLAGDPLPLRKARITNEAAVKKAEKAAVAAEEARVAAEAALADATKKLKEAEAYLQEVRNRPGSAQGSLWWIERELHEAKAYAPQNKGGYKKA